MRDTDNDWKLVAEREPYWGVLSDDSFRQEAMNSDAYARFMQSGEKYVSDVFALVRHHLAPDFRPQRALDVGCGVGRLLLPLARRVQEAVGVDVAPAMLSLAEGNAKRAGIQNIQLLPSDDGLSQVTGQFDFVNCYIVLQHIPQVRGYRLIQSMLNRLEVGGVGSVQVTYAKARKFLGHEAPKAQFYRRDGGSLVDIVATEAEPDPGAITMYDYDLNQVTAIISVLAGNPVIGLPTFDDSHLGVHYIFRRGR